MGHWVVLVGGLAGGLYSVLVDDKRAARARIQKAFPDIPIVGMIDTEPLNRLLGYTLTNREVEHLIRHGTLPSDFSAQPD